MTAVTAGTSKTFTAQVDGSAFVVIAPGGAVGSVIDQNGNTQAIDPNGTRRTFGPLRELQSITVSMQIGNASVELNGWSGGMPITAETNSSGQTVLDDASRAALASSGLNLGASASVLNLKASNTTITRNMLASSGVTRGILQFVGDSFIQGRGANGNGDVGARPKSWPVQAVSVLNTLGYTAQADSVCGWGSVSPSTIDGYIAYDPRVSYSGTVTKYSGIAGLGYEMFQLAAGATLTFTPGGTFDTVDVFYAAKAAGATSTFTVSDAGGVKATIDCNVGTAAIQKTTVTLAAGSTYVTFTGGAAASTISFFKTRTAANPVIEAINCGQSGKPVQQWAPTAGAAPYGTQASLDLVDSGLSAVTVIDGWYNDLKTPRTLTQLQTDLRALCAWAKTNGDLWYVNYAKLNPAQVDEATFTLWSQAAIDIVINEYDGVVVNMAKIIPDNAAAYTQGLINADLLHLQKGGHTLTARAFANAMTSCIALG